MDSDLLKMLEGLTREHEPRCMWVKWAQLYERDPVRHECTCGAAAHNARVDALRARLLAPPAFVNQARREAADALWDRAARLEGAGGGCGSGGDTEAHIYSLAADCIREVAEDVAEGAPPAPDLRGAAQEALSIADNYAVPEGGESGQACADIADRLRAALAAPPGAQTVDAPPAPRHSDALTHATPACTPTCAAWSGGPCDCRVAPTPCADHWHCDPVLAAHGCDAPDRSKPCPSCGDAPADASTVASVEGAR